MNKLHKNQQGFTFVEVLLVILILAVIGFGGYYVWHTQHMAKPIATVTSTKTTGSTSTKPTTTLPTGSISTTTNTNSYTYPGGYFSLTYPGNWIASAFSDPPAASQPGILATGLTITPPNSTQGETTGITVYKGVSLSNALRETFVGNDLTAANTQSLTINNYQAMYQTESAGTDSTDDVYALTDGTYTVVFDFRVTQTADQSIGLSGFNLISLLPEFNAIVTSIKF
jgi:prepilin-type N-terminal cleavage/methylation domain-containing protein